MPREAQYLKIASLQPKGSAGNKFDTLLIKI